MRKLSTRERVLLAILVVVAVVSGYVLLFSMPLNEKIQTLGQEIMESEDLKTQLESRWSQQQRLQQLTEQLKKQEGEVRYMPEYDNLQAVMVELNTILADCQEYSLAFQPDDPEDAIYARRATIPFTCGSYDQARDVLQRLHDSAGRWISESHSCHALFRISDRFSACGKRGNHRRLIKAKEEKSRPSI